MTATEHCYECVRLESDVENILFRITQLVTARTVALRGKDDAAVGSISRELGMALGDKYRVISYQREHTQTHRIESGYELVALAA